MKKTPAKAAPVAKSHPSFRWALPEKLNLPPDPLRLRLDFHSQAVVLYDFEGETQSVRIVSAMDVARALASELSFSTSLLPSNTLWWRNTREGAAFALYEPPQVRQVMLLEKALGRPEKLKIPLPGLIFVCLPGRAPWVYAVAERPTAATDVVYKAPLCNIFQDGRSCAGTNLYPVLPEAAVALFWGSHFTRHAELEGRSKKFPKDISKMWRWLAKGKVEEFPVKDLVKHGTVRDLMEMETDQ